MYAKIARFMKKCHMMKNNELHVGIQFCFTTEPILWMENAASWWSKPHKNGTSVPEIFEIL